MKRRLLYSVLAAAFLTSSRGDEPSTEDKSHYTLFNPAPADSLRVWRTDHAGVVPYTIDAGHLEVDVTAVSYGHDDELVGFFFVSGIGLVELRGKLEIWRYGFTQIKIGLLNNLDAEVMIEPYQTITATVQTPLLFRPFRRTVSGFGDLSSRVKLNVWGNDGGKTALSISGNATFPTANARIGGGRYAAGPSLEFAAQLPGDFELRINSGASIFEDNRDKIQSTFGNLISLSHPIVGGLEEYCAFNTAVFTSSTDWLGEIRVGLNYRFARNFELYAGSAFGVTDNAMDYQPFAGLVARF
jgi:hypothetical protein